MDSFAAVMECGIAVGITSAEPLRWHHNSRMAEYQSCWLFAKTLKRKKLVSEMMLSRRMRSDEREEGGAPRLRCVKALIRV